MKRSGMDTMKRNDESGAGVCAGTLVASYIPPCTQCGSCVEDRRQVVLHRALRAGEDKAGVEGWMGRRVARERRLHPFFIHNLRFLTFLGSAVAFPEFLPCTVVSQLLSWPHFSCAGRPSFETLDHSYPSRPIHATLPLSRSSDSHLPPSYRSSRSRLDTETRRVILHPILTAAVSSPPVLSRSYSTVLATVLVLGSWVSTSAKKAVRIGFHNRPGVDSTAGLVDLGLGIC
jgi:hypothetical protein